LASISDITTGNSYRGDSALGGANTGVIQTDIRPLQQLAQYTYLYNKSQYDQRQKDADEKIAELAKLTAYDLANARGKDKEAGIKALADLQKFGAEFAAKGTPQTPDEKIKQQLEYQTKIQEAENIITSVNARGIGYNARRNNILASNADAALKDTQLKQLDEEFDNTDIYTKISIEPKFDLSVPKIGAPIIKKTGVLVETPNGVVDQTLGFFDPASNMNAAFLEANGLELPTLPPNASALQKQEYEQKLKVKSTNNVWQDAAKIYNTALSDPKYQIPLPANEAGNQTGLDFNAIEANNPILHNTLQLIDRYNAYATERRADAEAGYYTDRLGNRVRLLQTVKPEDFFIIDKSKPLSPAQVVFLQKFADAAPDTKDEKFQYTGDAMKLQLENIQQAGQNKRNADDNATQRFIAGLKIPPKTQETLQNEAVVFSNNLINKISAATNADGSVDLEKAKITPLEWKMLGNSQLIEGKFSLDDAVGEGTPLGFDKSTNTILINPTTRTTIFGGKKETKATYVNFDHIVDNKYNTNVAIESGKVENVDRNSLIQGATKAIPSTTATVPATTTAPKYPLPNGKPYQVRQKGVTFTWNENTGQYMPE